MAGLLPGASIWFERHRQTMLITNAVSIALLFLLHAFATTAPASQQLGNGVSAAAIALAAVIMLSVAWKGLVPAIICALGLVLVHNSLILPFFAPAAPVFPDWFYNSQPPPLQPPSTDVAVFVGTRMHFFLGLFMVGLAMVIAFRPSLLSTRNQPVPPDDMWSRYPVWRDSILEGRHREPSVPATSLMDERDRYLMWRYEYVLADIYGDPHLVRPASLVPQRSTEFVRDEATGLLVGKSRFNGM